jgi:PadR family transcriptional regulator PadR
MYFYGGDMMEISRSLLSGSLSLLLLRLLDEEDMYGHQMIATLKKRSDETFALKAGTLYPLLHNLEKQQAVTTYEQTAASGRLRIYYSITPKGRDMLKAKKAEWGVFSAAVGRVLEGGYACAGA